ncbi:MAG: nucleotidyltransferase domain-containing protein [Candidatus Bathyarchaeia archaeon]
MSTRILVEIALKRREVFRRLPNYLKIIKDTARRLDPEAEVYMFGSVAGKNFNYSSDIDILIITRTQPANVHLEL